MWAAEIGDLSPVSCAVTAESDIGFPVEAAVAGAPAGCGSPLLGAGLYAEKLRIELRVDGAAGTTVYRSGRLVDSTYPETGELVTEAMVDRNRIVDMDQSMPVSVTVN